MTLPSSGPLSLANIQTEFGGSNPIGINEYYAGGGLVPAGTSGTYGAVPSSGALSVRNFYGTSNFVPTYIENVFSTTLYVGENSSSFQIITNNINFNLGGMIWFKNRQSVTDHLLFDTVRGADNSISSNTASAQTSGWVSSSTFYGFGSTGVILGPTSNAALGTGAAGAGLGYTSWSFRKQPNFFDIVTYTGDGTNNRNIAHNLGSVPGCIMVKRTDSSSDWLVYHRSAGGQVSILNSTYAAGLIYGPGNFGNGSTTMVPPTSTVFTVGGATINVNGGTYVAYLFAHNAGGFGLTATDNVISCGSYTGNGSSTGPTITLGYEPQWLLIKRATGGSGAWLMLDNMRGLPTGSNDTELRANTTEYETTAVNYVDLNATGFNISSSNSAVNTSGSDYIYIAIRRGPMKVPTSATTVFNPRSTSSAAGTVHNIALTPDMQLIKQTGNVVGTNAVDRLRGVSNRYQVNDGKFLLTSSTAAEATNASTQYWNNVGYSTPSLTAGITTIYWTFGRAPGFFDEVCDTGTGAAHTVSHNLQAVPQLIIRKGRSGTTQWEVYSSALANTEKLVLNSTSAKATDTTAWNSTTPTSSVFTVGTSANVNASSATYVTYLFATCAGVSKVGSYTGTGATQTISCGFTGGARFVLIKRADSTGDWYVWDTARGMFSLFDPSVSLNSTAAEVNGTSVYTVAGGFEVVSTAAGINASGGTYIYLAIA